jgi:hypothetical protein
MPSLHERGAPTHARGCRCRVGAEQAVVARDRVVEDLAAVKGLQLSLVQWIASWQERSEPAGVHVPDWHVSKPSHTSPSEQLVPFATGVCTHAPPAPHVSTVHGFWSSHVRGPLTHWPLWQVATPLHALPSSHAVPLLAGVLLHTPFAAHASVVHVLPSLQSAATAQKPLPGDRLRARRAPRRRR